MADISQFRELLRQGVDINIYDEVGIIIVTVVCPVQYNNNYANGVTISIGNESMYQH